MQLNWSREILDLPPVLYEKSLLPWMWSAAIDKEGGPCHVKIQWLIAKLTDGTLRKMLTQLHWIYQYGRRYWKAMILYTVLVLPGTGISLCIQFYFQDLVDIITGHQTGELLRTLQP